MLSVHDSIRAKLGQEPRQGVPLYDRAIALSEVDQFRI